MIMDLIYITRLPLFALIGVYTHEKEHPQPLYLDLEISFPLTKASKSDSLEDTLDYSSLCHRIQASAAEGHCDLIEKRLTDILENVLSDERVLGVTGRLHKPGAVPGTEITVERTLTRSS